jgi:hypothetical protein
MSRSTSHREGRSGHQRGAHGGGSHHGGGEGGGGGGGGGGGKLVKVAFARNQAEAEMLQGLLLAEGIPSVLKRTGGFDNPDFLSAGPHDVYVSSEVAQTARDVLTETMLESEDDEIAEVEGQVRAARGGGGETSPGQLALWVAVAFFGALILVWILYQLS